jgi:hypothetical protein
MLQDPRTTVYRTLPPPFDRRLAPPHFTGTAGGEAVMGPIR